MTMKSYKYRGIVAAAALLLMGSAHAFNMGNMMNPAKWMGGNNNQDRGGEYYGGGPGYGGGLDTAVAQAMAVAPDTAELPAMAVGPVTATVALRVMALAPATMAARTDGIREVRIPGV